MVFSNTTFLQHIKKSITFDLWSSTTSAETKLVLPKPILRVVYTRGIFKNFQCAGWEFCYFSQAYGKLVNIDYLVYFFNSRLYWRRIYDLFTIEVAIRNLNYVHVVRLYHANVIIQSCYYQLLSFSLSKYRKYHVKGYSSPITLKPDTAIVHLPIQSGTNNSEFICLDSVIIVLKASAPPKQLHTGIYLYVQSVVWQYHKPTTSRRRTRTIYASNRLFYKNHISKSCDQPRRSISLLVGTRISQANVIYFWQSWHRLGTFTDNPTGVKDRSNVSRSRFGITRPNFRRNLNFYSEHNVWSRISGGDSVLIYKEGHNNGIRSSGKTSCRTEGQAQNSRFKRIRHPLFEGSGRARSSILGGPEFCANKSGRRNQPTIS